MLETIQYEKRERLAFVTLNRPDAKNAIDLAMHGPAGVRRRSEGRRPGGAIA